MIENSKRYLSTEDRKKANRDKKDFATRIPYMDRFVVPPREDVKKKIFQHLPNTD